MTASHSTSSGQGRPGQTASSGSPFVISISLADWLIVFRSRVPALADSLGVLFAHHIDDARRTPGPTITIDLSIASAGDARMQCIEEGIPGATPWHYELALTTATALPNRLYYGAILPIIVQVLGSQGVLRLHAACIASAESILLVLGDSGAGKSSTAAGWLAGGGSLVGDDTLFVRESGSEFRYYGLRRPLHVPFDVVHYLSQLQGLTESPEYLPSRRKAAFDAWRQYPGHVLTSVPTPTHVLLSCVSDRPDTRWAATSLEAVGRSWSRAVMPEHSILEPPHAVADRCLARLARSQLFEISWGRDVWADPDRHYGRLRTLLPQPQPAVAAGADM